MHAKKNGRAVPFQATVLFCHDDSLLQQESEEAQSESRVEESKESSTTTWQKLELHNM